MLSLPFSQRTLFYLLISGECVGTGIMIPTLDVAGGDLN